MKFDSVILDIDGTIWNTTTVVSDAWNKAIENNYPHVKRTSAEILQGQFGKTMDVIADNLFPELTKEEKDKLISECCKMEHQYLSENIKDLTYNGVIEGIKKISCFLPVYIVSNCQDGYIELVLEKNKIQDFISDFECFGKTGLGKAENIKLICKRNNLKNPVYVGDTKGDEEACTQAGVPFIWAEYGFGSSDKFYAKIKQFSELIDLVK